MSGALPEPIPSEPSRPARHNFHSSHKWYLEFLEFCRAIAGFPVMVALFLEAYDVKNPLKAWITVTAVLVALVLRFFPKLRHMVVPHKGYALWMVLPWLLTAVLVFFLIFKEIPRRTKLMAESWMTWQQDFEQAAGQCTAKWQAVDRVVRQEVKTATDEKEKIQALKDKGKAEQPLDACLAENVGPVLKEPIPTAGVATGLIAGLRGQIMLANPNTGSALWDRMSVDDRFLGTGFSVPNGGSPETARVPEYLVPNLADESQRVWVWKIDYSAIRDQKPITQWILTDVLNNIPPANHGGFTDPWVKNEYSRLLVRFALFDTRKTPYSGCLGRPDATRVFMASLSELANGTVAAASNSTGYVQPEKIDEPGQTLFIWVYAPTVEDQAVRATWGNVLTNFGTWIMKEPCSRAN